LKVTKPSISHHLNALKHAGLIQDERQGQFIKYSLNTTVIQEVLGWFLELTNSGDARSEQIKEDDEA
jgi:DNA-binding transcriptional ArsR family regulator